MGEGIDEAEVETKVVEKLSLPERVFNAISQFIGAGIFLTGMYYSLERGVDVHWTIFGTGAALMGVGKALENWHKLKP